MNDKDIRVLTERIDLLEKDFSSFNEDVRHDINDSLTYSALESHLDSYMWEYKMTIEKILDVINKDKELKDMVFFI